jgi:S1-C subfamily serine protease
MSQETIGKYKIAKIVDAKRFVGTGFFVRQDYCVTCHHNIAHMEKIQIEADKKVVSATWIEEYSDL